MIMKHYVFLMTVFMLLKFSVWSNRVHAEPALTVPVVRAGMPSGEQFSFVHEKKTL